MAKLAKVTCADRSFRLAGLCALLTDRPDPTFRSFASGALAPAHQAPLVARPLAQFAAQHAAA